MFRLYYVSSVSVDFNVVIVSAKSRNQAKSIAYRTDGLCDSPYTDLRPKLIKEGEKFYDDDDRSEGFEVTGKGYIETEKKANLEWYEFKALLIGQERIEFFYINDDGIEIEGEKNE
jgi:hypothetical protein